MLMNSVQDTECKVIGSTSIAKEFDPEGRFERE